MHALSAVLITGALAWMGIQMSEPRGLECAIEPAQLHLSGVISKSNAVLFTQHCLADAETFLW
jgi:hypothetical protein